MKIMKSARRYFLPRLGFLAVALSCASEAAVVVTTSKSVDAISLTFDPPSGLALRLFQEPSAKSKFLAV